MRLRCSWHAAAAALALAVAVGCVDKGPGPQGKAIDPAYVEAHLLTDPPADLGNRIDADIGGKVVYLGNTPTPGPLAPGQKVTIKHYWKIVEPPGGDWRIFSHVRGDDADFQNVDATDMRTGHPTSKWKAGQIIEDVQEFTLRADWKSKSATLIVGLYPRGKHRIEDRLPVVRGPSQDNAVVAIRWDVDVSKAPPAPGTVILRKAVGPIVVDGKADEPAWATAAQSADFLAAESSPEPAGRAQARLTWDDQALYVFVQVTDPDVFSEFKNADDTLWKADDIEMFIDADGNKRGYVELQVNPNNAHFDSWFGGTRSQPGDPSWSSGLTSAVQVRGTADNRDDHDQGWDVEIAIPWAAVKGRDDAMKINLPPQLGDSWRLNVVRVDKPKGANVSASSWSKITYQDWHGLDRLLTVVFADATGSTKPTAAAPEPIAPAPGAGAGSAVVPPAGAAEKPPTEPAPTAPPEKPGAAKKPAAVKKPEPAPGSAVPTSPGPMPPSETPIK